jgi:hypothetical protein
MREITDPAIVNYFANHPDIRPSLGGSGPLELNAGMKPPNVFLFGEHGGFCWTWSAPQTFEVHVMLTRAGRGQWGVAWGREAIRHMAANGAAHLWGRVHPDRPEIAAYARLCGLRDTGTTHELDAGDGPVAWRIFNWRA